MEKIKIFKGGFINKEPVIGNDSVTAKIHEEISSVTFDNSEYIFKEKLKITLNNELILTNIKSKIDETIRELEHKNTEINDFLSANPDTPDEILLEKNKKEFSLLITKKGKTSEEETKMADLKKFIDKNDTEIVKIKKNKRKSLETNLKEIRHLNLQKSTIESYLKEISDKKIEDEERFKLSRSKNPFAAKRTGYSFDSTKIEDKDLKKLYTTYSEEQQRKNRLVLNEEYQKVFNNIVPIYQNSDGDIFSFLKGDTSTSKYLILEFDSKKNKYYEIYKNFTTWDGDTNIYELMPDFSLKFILKTKVKLQVLNTDKNIIYKNNGYINFTGRTFANKLIESKILTEPNFLQIINFYSKFLGKTFDKWLGHFGSWHRGAETVGFRQFHYHYDVNSLQCFTIANSFRVYFNLYNGVSFNEINDELKLVDLNLPVLSTDEIDEFTLLFTKNIPIYENKIYAFLRTLESLNKKQKIRTDNSYHTLYKYIKLIEASLDKIDAQILYVIMNNMVSWLKFDNANCRKKLIYAYNFLKLNSLYRISMDPDKSWPNEERFFDNIKRLNQFIKLDEDQLELAFYINFLEELYDIKKVMILTTDNKFIITLVWYIFFKQLEDNPLIKKLTNIQSEFGELLEKDFSNAHTVSDTVTNFYNSLLNSSSLLQDYTEIKYNNRHVYRTAINPETGQTNFSIPYCGEITLLNFLMVLIYDKKTKQLQSSYLPDSTLQPLKDLFSSYKNIKDLDTKDGLINYYDIIEHIKYGIVSPWDDSPQIQIYKRASKNYATYNFDRGIEYRLTYFNLCRAASYLLNLNGELELRTLERTGVDENTLQKIIEKFKNPNISQILSNYQIIGGIASKESFYNGDIINVMISDVKFSLATGHSFPTILSKSNDKIKTIVSGLGTFYDDKFSSSGWNILESIFVAITKNEYIYSEITFRNIPDEDIIKFFSILKELTENYHIPRKLISLFRTLNKGKVLDYIFNNFVIIDKIKWLIYFKSILSKPDSIKKIKEMLPIYFKNGTLKINKLTGEKIINNVILQIFLNRLDKNQYIQIEEFININSIKNNLAYILNLELFKYLTKDNSIFNKLSIKTYIDNIVLRNIYVIARLKVASNLNYEFLNSLDKSLFEYKIVYPSIYFIGIKANNYDLIKFLLSKNVDFPNDSFNYQKDYNIFNNLDNIKQNKWSLDTNILVHIYNKKMYDLFINHMSSNGQDLKFVKSDSGKMILLYNCSLKFLEPSYVSVGDEEQNIINLVIEVIDVLKSDTEKVNLFIHYFNQYKISDCKLLLLIKYFKKYLDQFHITKIFLIDFKYNCTDLHKSVCDETYNDFKAKYFNHIKLVDHQFVISNPEELDESYTFNMKIYFPLAIDLFANEKIPIENFCTMIQMNKYKVDLLILFFRKEENQKFLFTKNSNFIMKFLDSIDLNNFDRDSEQQTQFIRFFAFLLKYTFKSVLYIHCSFFVDKKKFKEYLVTFIRDILESPKKIYEGLTLENYIFTFKIIDLMLEKNKEYVLSLDPKMRGDANFIDNNRVEQIIISFFEDTFNLDTIPKTNLFLNRIVKHFDPYVSKYMKYKNKYLSLKRLISKK